MQIPTALQSNPSHLFKLVRFATYGGEPKEAHRIPLGLPKQTQTHSPTCSLPKVANTYGGEGSEHHMVAKVAKRRRSKRLES